jgi:hypothetical protein
LEYILKAGLMECMEGLNKGIRKRDEVMTIPIFLATRWMVEPLLSWRRQRNKVWMAGNQNFSFGCV